MIKSKILSLLSAFLAAFVLGSSLLPFIKQAEAVVIQNLAVTSVTDTSATISWNTDVAADSLVEFGVGGVYMEAVDEVEMKTAHSLMLLGLQPGTAYTYKVSSAEESGEVAYADEGTFTTTGSSAQTTVAPTSLPEVNPAQQNPVVPPTTEPVTLPVENGLQFPSSNDSLQMPDTALQTITETETQAESFTPLYPTGTLAKEGSTIYFLMSRDMVKVPFTSMKAFKGLGYSLKNVKSLDLKDYTLSSSYFLSSDTQEHPWGSCLVWKDGTVYYHTKDGMAGIPSLEIAESIGCTIDKIVPMNSSDDKIWSANPNVPILQLDDVREL